MTTTGTPSHASTDSPTHEPYKLMRSSKGRMLAGVAAGLAKASGLDVTVVRICIGASMLTGLGVVGYILLWIVLPDEQPSRGRVIEPAPENTARIIRITLVIAAVLGALQKVGVFWPFSNGPTHDGFGFDGILGLVLLSLGVGVLFSRHRPDRRWWEASPPPIPASAPTTTVAPPAPADDDTPDPATIDISTVAPGAAEFGEPERRFSNATLGWARAFGWFVLLWWVVSVLGFVALWRYRAIGIDAPLVIGVACWAVFTSVLNTLIRVRNPSAVVASLFLLAIPGAIGLATVRADGAVGTRTLRPVTAAALHPSYRQAIGELEVDLSATKLPTRRTTDIAARVGTGGMIITVPNNAAVTVSSKVQTGGYDILSKRTAVGVGQSETLRFPGCEGAPKLRLHLRAGAGWMQVKRANGKPNVTCTTTPETNAAA